MSTNLPEPSLTFEKLLFHETRTHQVRFLSQNEGRKNRFVTESGPVLWGFDIRGRFTTQR